MTSNVNVARRPSLEPIWTNYHNLGGMPRIAFRPVASPMPSPSPMSPKCLPSPMYPTSSDGSMRRQDRALIHSLDQRTRHPSLTSPMPLAPIDEQSPLVARLEKISILAPIDVDMEDGLSRLASPNFLPQRSRSMAARNPPDHYGHGQSHTPDRRVSMSSAAHPRPRRDSGADVQDQLRSWGHLYSDNAKTADAFVIARSLRRHSNNSFAEIKASTTQQTDGTPKLRTSNRQTVRAIIRPRAPERKPFLIQRNLDIDELRATIPDPPQESPKSPPNTGAHTELRHPISPAIRSAPLPTQRSRSSSVRSSTLLSSRTDYQSLVKDAKAVPIHLRYARAYLPVLAALLVSAHVREGDVVYLPMPHAEAWPQTARYVYTGQGELTQAMRKNILYLAGKV